MAYRYKVTIVEDNEWIGKLLREYSERYDLDVLDVVASGEELIKHYKNPDILLLDIELSGELDGISTVQILKESGFHPKVIMVSGTNRIDHILTSINDLESIYFLSKPVVFAKFQLAIQKAIAEMESDQNRHDHNDRVKWIFVKNHKSQIPINEESIVYVVKEEKRKTIVYLTHGGFIETSSNLSEVQAQCSKHICSPSKGYLVNLHHVISYEKEKGILNSRRYMIQLNYTQHKIPLSRGAQKAFTENLLEIQKR